MQPPTPPPPVLRPGRSRAGTVVAMALMLGALAMTVGMALALLGTSNLNLACAEVNRQRALEMARAGANQYLYDLDSRPTVSITPIPLLLVQTQMLHVLPLGNFLILPQERVEYPLRDSHLDGKCYITFNRSDPYYSVDNLSNCNPADGWLGAGTVPPYSLDLVVTGAVQGFEKHVEVVISKRWDYALTTPCIIDIGGSQVGSEWVPSYVEGDVYTGAPYAAGGSPVINVGRVEEDSGTTTYSSNNVVTGYLRVPSKNEASVHVETVHGQNSVAGTKFGTTENKYPSVALPDASGWTDLAAEYTWARRDDHGGSWLSSYVADGETCYAIETTAAHREFQLPAGSYLLQGNLVGTNQAGDSSSATDLVLEGTSLKVQGKMEFTTHPKRLYGNQAVLWVTSSLTLQDGFMDGGTNGFLVYARSVTTRAGGSFRGLLLVDDELSMSAYDKTLATGSAEAATFQALRLKSASSSITGSFRELGNRKVAGMYILGGVFTPKESPWVQLLLAVPLPLGLGPPPPPPLAAPPKRFTFRSVNLTWEPKYLAALHEFADLRISYWQEIP